MCLCTVGVVPDKWAREGKQPRRTMRFGVLGAAATARTWNKGLWGLASQVCSQDGFTAVKETHAASVLGCKVKF